MRSITEFVCVPHPNRAKATMIIATTVFVGVYIISRQIKLFVLQLQGGIFYFAKVFAATKTFEILDLENGIS